VRKIVRPTVDFLDLTSITRQAKRCITTVDLVAPYEKNIPWLRLGQCNLSKRDRTKEWTLDAHMAEGVCDFEHDSAYALKLPLIGVGLDEGLAVLYSKTRLVGWINPGVEDEFHVPPPGYDPTKHHDAHMCSGIYNEKKKQYCKWNNGKPHFIVPKGYYVPRHNGKLYEQLRGMQVEISIGAVLEEEQ